MTAQIINLADRRQAGVSSEQHGFNVLMAASILSAAMFWIYVGYAVVKAWPVEIATPSKD